MNKDGIEPLDIEDELVDETILKTSTTISVCFNEKQACQHIERSLKNMGIENGNKELPYFNEKGALGRQCSICSERFMRQEYFTHIRHSHLENYPHKCIFCKFMCQDLNQLKHHVKKKHPQVEVETTSLPKYHQENIGEVSNDLTKTNIDDDIILSDEDIDSIDNTRNRKNNNEKVSFICPLCFRKLKTLPNLKKHIMQHSNKRLECFLCQFMSIFKGQMSSHYYQEHPSKKLQWKEVFLDIGGPNHLVKDVEPYLFQVKIKYGIRKPNKASNLLRQYQCPHCDYISNFNSSYNRHLRIHGGKKDFKCGYCNFHAREAYVIHKHSQKIHLNQEVKVEKDIGYNVPYRYAKQSKLKSSKESQMNKKSEGNNCTFTNSTYSNDAIKEKLETVISDKRTISSPDISKANNFVRPSFNFRDDNHMLDYGIEKSCDQSYYEKSKESKVSYGYAGETRISKEMNMVSLNKGTKHSSNKSLEKMQYPLPTNKLEASQEISIVDKNLTKVDGVNSSDSLNYVDSKKIIRQNDSVSDLPSIVLCEDTKLDNEPVIILSVDSELFIENKFETKVPTTTGDSMKNINETLSIDIDSSIEQEMNDKSTSIIAYETFEDLETFKKGDNEFNVNLDRSEKECIKNALISQKHGNVPYASDGKTQDMIGLDYQNRDYFNPDKIREMMRNVGNGRLECTICGVTTTRRAFYKHAKKHFNIKPFQCGHCKYQAIEKSIIRVHNSRCHSGSQCVIIKISPSTASKHFKDPVLIEKKSNDHSDSLSFIKNMSNHNTEKNCNHNLEENSNIEPKVMKNKSVSSSNKQASFKCPLCEKELRYHLPTVRRHLYTHYSYKPFKCGLCYFNASSVGEIRGHHVTHRTTEEAKIESSGAVMDPNLTKLMEDIFGYGQTIT